MQLARTRARQRLIGSAVLVVAGVIGFPLLFATQPRPLPVDTPIEMARSDSQPQRRTPRVIVESPVPTPEPAPRAVPEVQPDPQPEPEPVPDAPGTPEPVPAPEPVASSPAPARAASRPADRAADRPAARASDKPPAERKPADAGRAQALLNGEDAPRRAEVKPAEAATGDRFIVQVGAFSEMNAARDARQKVEKLGLKTYTQVVETSAGNRIRVRVGPFANRAEADKAAARIKSSGLNSAVYTL